jgi:hypothetical protein
MALPVALPPTIGSCGSTKAAVRDRASLAQFIDDHLVEMLSPQPPPTNCFLLGKTQSSRQPSWRMVVFLQHSIRNEWAYGLAVVSPQDGPHW